MDPCGPKAKWLPAFGNVDALSSRCVASSGVASLDARYAVYLQHERCGDLDSAVEGDRVWMACTWRSDQPAH